jgi:hypothetical protein
MCLETKARYGRQAHWIVLSLTAMFVSPTSATVFINEISINPPGSLDDFREFIELQGVPGRRLDGYAIVLLNGTEQKFYNRNSIPPLPNPTPEIDEFFSLDGLTLGSNGLLVIAIATVNNYPECLSDTRFVGPWTSLWNGGLDIAGRQQNDGSNTVLLIRRRPGRTQADPSNDLGLLWAKGLRHDFELIPAMIDPQDGALKDQWGDGDLDDGQPNGLGGMNSDYEGSSTPDDINDDLEVVDEVSYESERGWEYDLDGRLVDLQSGAPGLPERRVHALDDPQGFNPDSLTRVDYRTSGSGWPAAPGAIGPMANGRNWPDTATEQWIRGENVVAFDLDGPRIYYDTSANPNPDSIQPFQTNVPRWLADSAAPEFSFTTNSYRLMAGRTNPLAIPFVPGDVNRDGLCNAADIQKLAAVFGDEDWIFSNSFDDAPEGNDGDPGLQIRPWDVDTTGDNGVEPSDLQWTLNFQGNSNGRVVGRRYDDAVASTTGVVLNSNAGVGCTLRFRSQVPGGRPLNDLQVGNVVELTIEGRVTSGAVSAAGRENGIMQFVHDLLLNTRGVVRVLEATPVPPFAITRASLLTPQGDEGDQGIRNLNGHTTVFTAGLSDFAPLYRVRLEAIHLGSANVSLSPAQWPGFLSSTPRGLKVGHTDLNGNPSAANYPAPLELRVTTAPVEPGDCDGHPGIGPADYRCFWECLTGPGGAANPDCAAFHWDQDDDIDLADWGALQNLYGTH